MFLIAVVFLGRQFNYDNKLSQYCPIYIATWEGLQTFWGWGSLLWFCAGQYSALRPEFFLLVDLQTLLL